MHNMMEMIKMPRLELNHCPSKSCIEMEIIQMSKIELNHHPSKSYIEIITKRPEKKTSWIVYIYIYIQPQQIKH